MKKSLLFISFWVIAFVFNSCQKEPLADFTSDTYYYHAGETIHLKDASMDAYQWKWTTPDGNTYETKDMDYATDINDTAGTLKFTLEVSSKKGDKKNSVAKSIILKQAIYPSDFFSVNSSVYIPIDKSSILSSSNNWLISATKDNNTYIDIFFFGNSPPTAGTYSLTTNNFSLQPGQASVRIGDGFANYYSYSGQITVTIPSTGKVRAVFNNVSDGSGSNLLSGDIICH